MTKSVAPFMQFENKNSSFEAWFKWPTVRIRIEVLTRSPPSWTLKMKRSRRNDFWNNSKTFLDLRLI